VVGAAAFASCAGVGGVHAVAVGVTISGRVENLEGLRLGVDFLDVGDAGGGRRRSGGPDRCGGGKLVEALCDGVELRGELGHGVAVVGGGECEIVEVARDAGGVGADDAVGGGASERIRIGQEEALAFDVGEAVFDLPGWPRLRCGG